LRRVELALDEDAKAGGAERLARASAEAARILGRVKAESAAFGTDVRIESGVGKIRLR